MEFTTTERGNRQLIKDGYIYVFKKDLANDVSSWECALRRKGTQCNATVKLSILDEYLGMNNAHTHPPSQTQVEVVKVKATMKRRAETTEETTQQILGASLNNVSEGAAAIMPSVGSLRRNIRHARQDRNMPPNPLTRDAIPILPQQYQETTTGENFLVFDSGVGDPNRIFIFGSNQGL